MRKLILVLALASFIFYACNKKEDRFVDNLVKETKKIQAVHYKITEKYYYSTGQDTAVTPYEIWAARDNQDSLRHGYVWANNYYRPYNMFYDKGDFYLAIPPKKVTVLFPHYTESLISDVDWIDIFLNPGLLQKQISDPKNTVEQSDIQYFGRECKKIVIHLPENKNGQKTTYSYIFDKKTFLPSWALVKSETKDYTFYDELFFADFEFNNVNVAELRTRQQAVLAENPVEDRKSGSATSVLENMLHIGEKAPLFEGKFYTDGSTFKLSDYIGKNVIIVDFWYTHCPPCVRAIPALKKLYKEKKEAGLKIFGLNSVDNQPRSLKYLDKFLAKRDVNYDIVMIQPDVDLRYKIKFYPTLYIIDKTGKIAFAEIGYNEAKFNKIKVKIDELVQK